MDVPSDPTGAAGAPGPRRFRSRGPAAVVAGAGLTAALLAPVSASAAPQQPAETEQTSQTSQTELTAQQESADVVISEVYTTGAGTDAAFDQRFIELQNTGETAVDLSGWSINYRPSSRGEDSLTPSGHTDLSGTVEPGGHYLISNPGLSAGDGQALPQPDEHLGGTTAMRDGIIWLSDSDQPIDVPLGDVQDVEGVVDLLGYGDANTVETAAADSVSGSSDVRSMVRTDGVDTDDNSADFTLSSTITPTNSAGEQIVHEGGGENGGSGESDRNEPVELTIDEIPRSLDASENELLEQPVTVSGVVTAAYPTGGFDGFVVQTPGTGGDVDLDEHTASDAVFVYSPWQVGEVSVGDHVELTADVTTYSGQVQLSLYAGSDQTPEHALAQLDEPAEAIKPAVVEFPETEAARQSLAGMLIDPQGSYTVTDNYTLNQYGELGVVAGSEPLSTPTDVVAPGEQSQALAAENAERLFYLDDGSSTNLSRSPGWDQELPYITSEDPVRIGAEVQWEQPVIVDHRYDEWRLQPTGHLTGETAEQVQPASIEDTRAGEQQPAAPEGDVRLASFNVLNYFVHLGEDEQGCDYYSDRDGEPTTTDWCTARGAYSQESFERQQTKIVSAINALDADVVALQEIENSAHFTEDADRDLAIQNLVDALNADAGSAEWAAVASPEETPAVGDEDVIRNGFIHRVDAVEPVGDSRILFDEGIDDIMTDELSALDIESIFSNAREPLAQQFQPVDGDEDDRFFAIVNHLKSKGSAPDDGPNAETGDGQGAWNAARQEQAGALDAFADALAADTGTERVFLMGDFNSYTQEDPMQVLADGGFSNLAADVGDSYAYDGQVGSLDHVLGTEAAAASVVQTDIWNINSVEPIAAEYSRYNGSATDLYAPDQWRASDHDPVIVDIALDSEDGSDDGSGGDGSGEDGSGNPSPGQGPPEGKGHNRDDHPGNGPGQNNGSGNGIGTGNNGTGRGN
ncbi:hypothetical protein GCM10027060_08230 [Nesterenkonia halophila]|uniref:ExeM/NucH family extracellular endonuclease n=1 Tax=Nesterenkonia halophila TaxID=302044 RepID=UPI00147813A8|nr:ExeM/NucH family extracellular endonuclease [Nesterenkonia halophila]